MASSWYSERELSGAPGGTTGQHGAAAGLVSGTLRGAPAGATLLLIDGKRAPKNNQSRSGDGFDLNGIPLAAIRASAARTLPELLEQQVGVTMKDFYGNNGALTIPATIYGNPAVSIPAGQVRGLPVGLQVLAPHHREEWLLDCMLAFERARPWPLTAPGSPA